MDLINWEQGGTAAAVDWTADPLLRASGEEGSLCVCSITCLRVVCARKVDKAQTRDRSTLTGHRPE
jgi:hypothetical protein